MDRETSKIMYEQSIKLVTIQGLQILRNEADQEVLPPIKRAKRGHPKVARIRTTNQEDKCIYTDSWLSVSSKWPQSTTMP